MHCKIYDYNHKRGNILLQDRLIAMTNRDQRRNSNASDLDTLSKKILKSQHQLINESSTKISSSQMKTIKKEPELPKIIKESPPKKKNQSGEKNASPYLERSSNIKKRSKSKNKMSTGNLDKKTFLQRSSTLSIILESNPESYKQFMKNLYFKKLQQCRQIIGSMQTQYRFYAKEILKIIVDSRDKQNQELKQHLNSFKKQFPFEDWKRRIQKQTNQRYTEILDQYETKITQITSRNSFLQQTIPRQIPSKWNHKWLQINKMINNVFSQGSQFLIEQMSQIIDCCGMNILTLPKDRQLQKSIDALQKRYQDLFKIVNEFTTYDSSSNKRQFTTSFDYHKQKYQITQLKQNLREKNRYYQESQEYPDDFQAQQFSIKQQIQ